MKRKNLKCHVVRVGHSIVAYRFLFGSRKGKRPLGGSTLIRMDDIKMDPQEVEWGQVLDWFLKSRDSRRKLVNAVMNSKGCIMCG